MPNAIAYMALIVWPIVTFAIFAFMRPEKAIVWSLLAGYLLLPVKASFDFPGIPAFDKTTIANISTYFCALLYTRGHATRLPKEGWIILLAVMYVVSPALTVFSNFDTLAIGGTVLPGLKPYDAFSAASYRAIDLMPFVLGLNMLGSRSGQREILRSISICALGYSLLMLIEIRLSPQLHVWIYGFFPHEFGQQMRGGGFRPVVFLGHGLIVAIFTAMAAASSVFLGRRREIFLGISFQFWSVYIFIVLLMCKSFGALILAIAAIGMLLILNKPRTLQAACAIMAAIVLLYPALRGFDAIPVQSFANQVANYSGERSGSFQFRVDNENQLLARANQRPLFGWGGFGRNRVFDEESGRDLSVTDGIWVIIVGSGGWISYIATFGLLCLPIIVLAIKRRRITIEGSALSVVLVVNLVDLIPNSSLSPMTWVLAGSIAMSTVARHQPALKTDARFGI